jgi:hypothetical protein
LVPALKYFINRIHHANVRGPIIVPANQAARIEKRLPALNVGFAFCVLMTAVDED